MNRVELEKRITGLEEIIQETDTLMLHAWASSVLMVEPYKSVFEEQLRERQAHLEENRIMLEVFKNVLKD